MNKLQFEDLKCILKEGWIEKESRFFKKWHRRWIVLTQHSLYTFKKEKQYFNPTEIIKLGQISAIRQETDVQEEFRFVKVIHSQKLIQTIDCIFNMRIENEQEQQRWINLIIDKLMLFTQQSNDQIKVMNSNYVKYIFCLISILFNNFMKKKISQNHYFRM